MPATLDDYIKAGGFAKDAQTSANLGYSNKIGDFGGGSSSGYDANDPVTPSSYWSTPVNSSTPTYGGGGGSRSITPPAPIKPPVPTPTVTTQSAGKLPQQNVNKTPTAPVNTQPKQDWEIVLDDVKNGKAGVLNDQLSRASSKYMEYLSLFNASNNEDEKKQLQDQMNAAHLWANQLREAGGVANQYDQTTGEYTGQPQATGSNNPAATGNQPQAAQQPSAMDMFNAIMAKKLTDSQLNDIDAKAGSQFGTFQQGINNQIGLLNNQNTDAQSKIDQEVKDSRRALEDKTFQDYLSARQEMANRGLAGSGIASDQDLRLQMANNRQLAGILGQANNNKDSAQRDYSTKLLGLQNQLNSKTKDDFYRELYKSATDNLQKEKDSELSNFSNFYQFEHPKADTVLNATTDLTKTQMNNDTTKYTHDYQSADNAATNATSTANNQNTNMTNIITTGMNNDTSRANNETTNATNIATTGMNNATSTANTAASNASAYSIASLKAETDKLINENSNATTLNVNRQKLDAEADKAKANAKTDKQKQAADNAKVYSESAKSVLAALEKTPNDPKLKEDYAYYAKKILEQLDVASGFNDGQGGGGYNNYQKLDGGYTMNKNYGMANTAVSSAVSEKGLPSSWVKPMLELAARESSFDPEAQNPTSSAYGLFQFLNGTWKGGKTSDPKQQALEAIDYIKQRYGTPEKALQFWDANHWY